MVSSSSVIPKMRIRGIVLDMDGTITQPHAIDFKSMRSRCHIPSDQDIISYIEAHAEPLRSQYHKIIEEEEDLGLERMQLQPGCHELFEWMHSQNHVRRGPANAGASTSTSSSIDDEEAAVAPVDDADLIAGLGVGLLTRNNSAAMHQTVALLGRPDAFHVMLSRSFMPCKPHPAPLHHIANVFGCHVSEIVMVGDAVDDVMCGRAAGAKTILIGADPNDKHYQEALPHADATVRSLFELKELLATWVEPPETEA